MLRSIREQPRAVRVVVLFCAIVLVVVAWQWQSSEAPMPSASAVPNSLTLAGEQHALVPSEPTLPKFKLSEINNNKVLFVYYHKTGHDLVRELVTSLSSGLNARKRSSHSIKRSKVRLGNAMSVFNNADLVTATAPTISRKAWEVTRKRFPTARLVTHFRDPYAMAISGWAYHSNAPSSETWAHKKMGSFCDNDRNVELLKDVESEFGVHEAELKALRDLCNELEGEIPNFEHMSYMHKLEYLNSVDKNKGLMFEAVRLILFGDLVRMVHLAVSTRDEPTVLNVYLSQFTHSSDTFDKTIDCLTEFIGVDVYPNITEIKQQVGEVADLHRQKKLPNHHVTSTKITHEERVAMVQYIKDSRVATAFARARELVLPSPDKQWPFHCNVPIDII